MKLLSILILFTALTFGQSASKMLLLMDDSWADYWKTQDLNFWVKSRDGLALVDDFGNNPTLLPAVWNITNTNQVVNFTTAITMNTGTIEINALYPSPSSSFIILEPTNQNFIALISTTILRVRLQGTVKDYATSALSTTELTNFKIVFRQDAGATKVRVYFNGIESSSGEQSFGIGKSLTGVTKVGSTIGKIAYVNINNGTNNILTYHLTGLAPYVYDASGNGNHGLHTNTISTSYLAGGSTYLMDNDFTIYEKYGSADIYLPDAYTTAINTIVTDIGSSYQIKESFKGSLTNYNLAPALIQFTNDEFDRSNTTIWNNSARAGYYDTTSTTTKKRWHSTELNQNNFNLWLQSGYNCIAFTKFAQNEYYTGRMLQEIMLFDTLRVNDVLQKTYSYTQYKPIVQSLSSSFVASTLSGDLSWTDNFMGAKSFQIWSSINGASLVYKGTTSAGATSYSDTTCKQGAWVKYYIKPTDGAFNSASLLYTPYVLTYDASVPDTFNFQNMYINSGTVNFDWGDATNTNYTSGANRNPTKIYSTPGIYNITISGDVRRILLWDCYNDKDISADITNWVLPPDLTVWHFYSNDLFGDITDHDTYITDTLHTYHLGYSPKITGDLSQWDLTGKRNLADIHFENDSLLTGDFTALINSLPDTMPIGSSHYVFSNCKGLTGDITDLVVPYGINWLRIVGCNFTGDLTNFGADMPATLILSELGSYPNTNNFTGDVTSWVLPTVRGDGTGYAMSFIDCGLSGDMSGVLIPDYLGTTVAFNYSHNAITKVPRGVYNKVAILDFSYNSINQSEIDAFFAFLDSYFVGGVVPTVSCLYNFTSQVGSAYPSAAGLVSIQNVKNKYISAGKVATVLVDTAP